MYINLTTGETKMLRTEAIAFYKMLIRTNGNPSTNDFLNEFGKSDGYKLFQLYLYKFINYKSETIVECSKRLLYKLGVEK